MSSIFSTQNRHTFLRRKYCFLPTAAALSPPVGRCDAAIGLLPFVGSAMTSSPSLQPVFPEQPAPDAPMVRAVRAVRPARDVIPPRLRPAWPAPAKAAALAAPAADARASRAPSSVCPAASAFHRCAP